MQSAGLQRILSFSSLPKKIDLFKDKSKFRQLIRQHYPHFDYRVVTFEQLASLSVEELTFPFVIKPVTGFFSIGVHVVNIPDEWQAARELITTEFGEKNTLFPEEVINAQTFIVEQYIEGEEYAIDAYYDQSGEPCVLNILQHMFTSASDVGDRIYSTSKEIIEKNLSGATILLKNIGDLADLRNFPVHLEVRIDHSGKIQPIELNPMRFGGWCSTPDLTFMAYGINPYEAFAYQQKPEWEKVLQGKDGKTFSLVILDNPTGMRPDRIVSFDYEKLLLRFDKPLELRKLDIHQYPIFGFLFLETQKENFTELQSILNSDMWEFIRLIER